MSAARAGAPGTRTGLRIRPRGPLRRSWACSRSWRSRCSCGAASLGATQRRRRRRRTPARRSRASTSRRPTPAALVVYLGALLARRTSRSCSRAVGSTRCCCPTVAMLGGIGLLLMERLPQDLVAQSFGGRDAGPRPAPAGAGCCSRFAVIAALAIVVRSDALAAAATSTRGPRPASRCCCCVRVRAATSTARA